MEFENKNEDALLQNIKTLCLRVNMSCLKMLVGNKIYYIAGKGSGRKCLLREPIPALNSGISKMGDRVEYQIKMIHCDICGDLFGIIDPVHPITGVNRFGLYLNEDKDLVLLKDRNKC